MPFCRGCEPDTASSITEGFVSGDAVCADADAIAENANSATNKADQRLGRVN
jgi:hypothetical protein